MIGLAVPAVVENLLQTLVFLVDTLLIGWLKDPATLAAVSLASLFLNTANQIFAAVAITATSLVAHAWGAGEFERARRTAAQALSVSVGLAVVSTIVLWPAARPLMTMMGTSERAIDLGTLYMQTILVTSVLSFPMLVLNGVLRGSGDTRTPMAVAAAMNVINVIGASVLVFGLGPFPAMGLQGAAIATAGARLIGGLLSLALVMSGKRFLALSWRDVLRVDLALARRMLSLSLPTAGETVLMRLGFMLFIRIVSGLGEASLAANQLAVNVESLSFMPGLGLSVASTTLVGQSLGARRPDLAEETVRIALRLSMLVMGLLSIVFALWGPAIVALFGSTPEVSYLAGRAVRLSALEQLSIAAQMVIAGSMRGAGDMRTPVVATLIGTFAVRVPLVYWLAVTLGWGLDGVWIGTAVDWGIRGALLYLLFRRGDWKRAWM